MIAAAIVCAAAFAQAANYNWNAATSCIYAYDTSEAAGWPTVAAGTSAYFVFVEAYSQSDLVDDFAAGTVNMTKLNAAGVGEINADGGIDATAAVSSYEANKQAYFVVFQDSDHMFVSSEATAVYNAFAPQPVAFEDQDDYSDNTVTAIRMADAGYQDAGWYQTVPEPTSGLLLLLGVAGLALRRRRA